jgi:putative transposase
MDVFFSDDDRHAYLELLAEQGEAHGVEYLAWCLMSNHVHLIAVPASEGSLAKGIGEAHKRYTRRINFRQGWRGYLFQGRFFSCPIEESKLIGVVRYVLCNPLRAGLADQAWGYQWSSARWLVGSRESDPLVRDLGPLTEITDWRTTLGVPDDNHQAIRQHTRTGRPLGSEPFIDRIEGLLGRSLKKRKPGPAPKR